MASARIESSSRYIQYENPNKERTWTVFLASISASLATVNFGYALGYTAQVELSSEFKTIFSDGGYNNTFSIFASVVALGALVGSLLAGWLIDKIGRKRTILCTSLFYTPGWLLIAYSHKKKAMLYFGRVLSGMGVGMSSLTVPVYIAEVASARNRGGFGNFNQLSISFGFLIAYVVGLLDDVCATSLFPVGIVLLNVAVMVFMPETPRWLLANNYRHEAIKALSWLRGNQYQIEEECFEIECALGFEDQQDKWTRDDLKEPIFYRPLIIGLLLMFFQQFSGINCILFYCSMIFSRAGIGPGDSPGPDGDPTSDAYKEELFDKAQVASIFVCITLFVFTLVSCVLADRVGRRKLFLAGSVVMTIVLFLMGSYFWKFPPYIRRNIQPTVLPVVQITATSSSTKQATYAVLALVGTLLYVAFYSIGWGPLPWLLMSEFFPIKTRGLATSIVTCANWLFVFTTTVIFDPMTDAIREDGVFWFFGCLTFFGLLFALYFVPETKGKPLEDVTDMFLNNRIWRLNRNYKLCHGMEHL